MSLRRRGGTEALNPWPGYVDALSTLLMVIIFVLLVFVLAQAFLSVSLSGKDRALDQLNRQMAELTDMLSLEKGHNTQLQASVAGLTHDLQAATGARDQLQAQLGSLQAALADNGARQSALQSERDRLAAELADNTLQAQSSEARTKQLQQQLADTTGKADTAMQSAGITATQLSQARQQLAETQDKLAKTMADQQTLSNTAQAQLALMTRQVEQLRLQLAQVSAALNLSEQSARDKDAQITNLGSRLNTALAAKVEELQRYRSDFFARLRDLLANRPGVRTVGDRFVFQSEVLFPTGSADLTPAGQDEMRTLAATIKQIATEIPADQPWILRVDGHADRNPTTRGGQFVSNWELSSQRAINVVKLLIAEGVPAQHLAATGFAEYQPLDNADTPEAFAKNRRIELRLTDR